MQPLFFLIISGNAAGQRTGGIVSPYFSRVSGFSSGAAAWALAQST